MKLIQTIRDFVANRQARTSLMWVFVAVGLVVLAFGLYVVITNHLEHSDLQDKIDEIKAREEAYLAPFLVTQDDGTQALDYDKLTQADQMMLVKFRSDEREAKNKQVNAYNQRSQGIRILGFGVIGLALGYLVSPERKKEPAGGTIPPADEQPPFDVSQ